MSFVQPTFVLFFAVVWVLYWAIGARRPQNVLLVVASAVFYGWVHPWFVILMYGSAILDFALAQVIERFPSRKRQLVLVSVICNLGLLAWFKYFDFFVENVIAALQALGLTTDLSTLGLLLPVGISFYTFQTMGYTIDVSRGELRARRNFIDYLLYVSFFAQLVAGPIERAGRLLPQIEAPRQFSWTLVRSGFGLAMWGGFKKLVVADTVAPYVDKVFVLEAPAGPLLWAATFGFMIQIYADFSGYTDIARGTARMLGFHLTENFRAPFLARTTIEFWQRWHMSLSFWIRDYVLGPLVGDSPKGVSRWRFAWATLLTFVLIGFWHGPSWNFILFGLYQGIWVILYGVVVRWLPGWARALPGGGALAVAFHLGFVSLIGTMLFREQHLSRIIRHLSTDPFAATPEEWIATVVILVVTAAVCVPLLLGYAFDRWIRPHVQRTVWHLPLQTTAWAAYGVAMVVFYRLGSSDFVYFQF